jgi:hypothetical protein
MVCAYREGLTQCSWWTTCEFNSQLKSYCSNPNVLIQNKIIGDGNQLQFITKREEGTIKVLKQGGEVTLEKQGISPMSNVTEEPEAINQKNTSVVGEQKQSIETNVASMSEINSKESIAVVVESKEFLKSDDSQLAHYANKATSEIQTKSHQQNVVKRPEIVNKKKKSIIGETKKSSKLSSTKELKTIKQENTSVLREFNNSPIPGVLKEPEAINLQITPAEVRQNESSKSDIVKELEVNLSIATTLWCDKLLPFQTSSWDSKHTEDEPLQTTYFEDLIQLYIDVGLANYIVWMATEFGHRSKELDESYMKLCASIAGRIKEIGLS